MVLSQQSTYTQCYAWQTTSLPQIFPYLPDLYTSTEVYYLVAGLQWCEQLAQCCYTAAPD